MKKKEWTLCRWFRLMKTYFYKLGTLFCERKFLPFLIPYIEPVGVKISTSTSELPDVDFLVTKPELQTTLEKYYKVEKTLILLLIFLLTMISAGIGKVIESTRLSQILPDLITYFIHFCGWLIIFIYWTGIYMKIKSRRNEWRSILNRSVLLERLENTAKITGSTIVAQIIVEIEKIKDAQEREIKKSKDYKFINAFLQTDTMKTFDDVMDKRDEANKWKKRRNNVLIFLAGYFAEKTLDTLLASKLSSPTA